jgi:hypothetical protein
MVFPSLLSTCAATSLGHGGWFSGRVRRDDLAKGECGASPRWFLSLAGVIALARCNYGSATADKLISLSFGSYKRHLSYNFRQRCQALWAMRRVAIRTARDMAPYLFAQNSSAALLS